MRLTAATCLMLGVCALTAAPPIPPERAEVGVFFSPAGETGESPLAQVLADLGGAKKSVLVEGYSFTSRPVAEALCAARARGVAVGLVLDRRANEKDPRSQAGACAAAGCEVYLDGRHAIHHSKVMVVDGETVLTGSYNWSNAAEHSNAENLVRLTSKALAKRYARRWADLRDLSAAWPGKK